MQEAEVSLRVALYYIKNQLTDEDVKVSLDGAHIKTRDTINFDIYGFLNEHLCHKVGGLCGNSNFFYPPSCGRCGCLLHLQMA